MLLSASLVGCGVKGPPVAPAAPPIPSVADLSYRLDGGTVILDWRLPARLSREQARVSVFGVYQSQSQLAEETCEGCPLVFEKVAAVPYVETNSNRFSTPVNLEPGFRYVFKVQLEINGQAGKGAERIALLYPPDRSGSETETP